DGSENIRLPPNPLGDMAPPGRRDIGRKVHADQCRGTIGMPSRGGETDAPSERMAHQHRSGPAEAIGQRNDVGAERCELIVAGRTTGRLAKAAHVDGYNLTVDGDA